MAHEIRLAGPWEYSTADGEWQRTVLPFPTDVPLANATSVQLRRKFHRPSGLDDTSQVFIVADVNAPMSALDLNDVELPVAPNTPTDEAAGERKELAVEVTTALENFNTVKFTFPVPCKVSNLLETVRLRIVEPKQSP